MPELRTHKLVIGYSLEALEFAQAERAMLLLNGDVVPHAVEEARQHQRWHRLTFDLGMQGLTPIPSAIESIRIEGDMARVITEFYRMIKIHFEKLYIYDMDLVGGLDAEEKIEEYVVYDWFNIKRGAVQSACKILTPRDFVRQVVFYPSARKDGNDGSFKDCYTKSYISSKDLQEFENSETAAKMAALRMIKKNGIRGPKRAVGDKVYYLNLVLEHDRRELHKNKKEFIQNDEVPSNINFVNTIAWR